jgi:hypothetical protein
MRTLSLLAISSLLFLGACGDAAVDLPQQLTVLHVAPHHGATNVALDVTVEIGFNDKLKRDTVDAQSVRLEQDGDTVELSHSFEAQQRQLTLVPDQPLSADTEYEIFIDDEVSGLDAGALGTVVRSRFRTVR